ncbi:MAG: MerR family DNA-binding transcriptional regulator [Planctomycetes bacterium]|nr:MerR family DNA-binding transcriptional regulator [Planctomycetota bacterium]
MTPPAAPPDVLSIGDLAEATGLGVETLRAWERRYGRPVPLRLPSGHRRYRADDVPWLRLVAEALTLGRRPSEVVALDVAALERLLARDRPPPPAEAASLGRWLSLVRRLDARRLGRALTAALASSDPVRFVDGQLAPFLRAVGRRWAQGRLSIRHEHLASEVVGDVLRRARSRCRPPRSGPVVLLATLAGERHGLPLEAAALVAASSGATPRVLGVDTPLEEIVEAARETRARAVLVAVSSATAGAATDRALAQLAADLPAGAALAIGGEGTRGPRRVPRGAVRLPSFAALADWLRAAVPGT